MYIRFQKCKSSAVTASRSAQSTPCVLGVEGVGRPKEAGGNFGVKDMFIFLFYCGDVTDVYVSHAPQNPPLEPRAACRTSPRLLQLLLGVQQEKVKRSQPLPRSRPGPPSHHPTSSLSGSSLSGRTAGRFAKPDLQGGPPEGLHQPWKAV